MAHEQLTALDSAFLYFERTAPLNIGSVGVIEGGRLVDDSPDRLADLRRHVGDRLHRLPRFRQKLQAVPFGLGHPVWVDDADFDIAAHVRCAHLPAPGGQAELNELVATIQAVPLDRSRPLWELWLVDGLAGGRSAVIQKMHHSLVDGISIVHVAHALLHGDADTRGAAPEETGWTPRPAPSPPALLAASLARRAAAAGRLLGGAAGTVRDPAQAARTAAAIVGTSWDGLQPVPRCAFNVTVGPRRRYDTFSLDVHDVRAVARHVGCTANDVVLAIVAGGLRRYLTDDGDGVGGPAIRAMVPVSLRRRSHRESLGNRLSAVAAELPTQLGDPLDRVRATAAEMHRLRSSHSAESVGRLLTAAEIAPPRLYAAVASRLPTWQRSVNLVLTSVPGPRTPLSCMGGQVTEAYPYLGPVGDMGLMVSVLRYGSRFNFGLAADPDTGIDGMALAEATEKSAAELVAAVP